jgi:2,3-bisphosphoglycerate-independent phosphoglycerate mutase
MDTQFFESLVVAGQGKIVLLVLDGLGGLPQEPGGKTELETARTPNLDALATRSALGLSQPAGPGVTVGSGPGHLALFGYDPVRYEIGRGALEALGVDFELGPDDLAARGNFCTLDPDGGIIDRRAGRLPTEQSRELAGLLGEIRIPGAEFFIEPVKEHRFAWVLRAPGLNDALSESDPLKTGLPPLPVRALSPQAEKTACFVNEFLEAARARLAGCTPANMITLRGFNKAPSLPSFAERYRLHAAAIAVNGMYRGVAKLAGMTVLDVDGNTPADEFSALERHWGEFDFFYLHIKKTDTCGESGNFAGKVAAIEEIDALLPRLLALDPDVVIVGGDHSSPAVMQAHSWHPSPTLLYARRARPDGVAEFGERACTRGSLGVLPATHLMPLALAHAGRVAKYGA